MTYRNLGPCMCGATDCPSCGPAQGYTVIKVWRKGRAAYINPEEGEEYDTDDDFTEPDPPEWGDMPPDYDPYGNH